MEWLNDLIADFKWRSEPNAGWPPYLMTPEEKQDVNLS